MRGEPVSNRVGFWVAYACDDILHGSGGQKNWLIGDFEGDVREVKEEEEIRRGRKEKVETVADTGQKRVRRDGGLPELAD